MDEQRRAPGVQTRLIHGAEASNDTPAVTPTIFYGRDGTPNTRQVEVMMAELDGAEAALAVGSGMGAITLAILSNVRAGDHVVAQQTHYTSALTLLAHTLPQF